MIDLDVQPLLEKVKYAMRIDEEEHDMELQDLIETSKALLKEAGIDEEKLIDTDPLIRKACILYCKAHFGYDDNRERFAKSFDNMLIHISLLTSYRGDVNA